MAQKPDWDKLFAWADENNIREEKLPRNKQVLFKKRELDLRDCELTELHPLIARLFNLLVLDLSNNKLTEISESIGKLKNLKVLILNNNLLTHIERGTQSHFCIKF